MSAFLSDWCLLSAALSGTLASSHSAPSSLFAATISALPPAAAGRLTREQIRLGEVRAGFSCRVAILGGWQPDRILTHHVRVSQSGEIDGAAATAAAAGCRCDCGRGDTGGRCARSAHGRRRRRRCCFRRSRHGCRLAVHAAAAAGRESHGAAGSGWAAMASGRGVRWLTVGADGGVSSVVWLAVSE